MEIAKKVTIASLEMESSLLISSLRSVRGGLEEEENVYDPNLGWDENETLGKASTSRNRIRLAFL